MSDTLTFKSEIEVMDSKVYGLRFNVPISSAEKLQKDHNRRVLCSINGSPTFPCALIPEKGQWYILLNRAFLKKNGLKPSDEISVTLEKDLSEYGMPMPEELEQCLFQETEALGYFRELSDGKKRNLIYIVNKVKSTESRIKKSLAIVHHLLEMQGPKIDFKRLNETIKYYNQKDI